MIYILLVNNIWGFLNIIKFLQGGTYRLETKEIFSRRIANYLLSKGCTLIQVIPNLKNKQKTVFIFKNDPNLVYYLNEVSSKIPPECDN